LHVLHDTTINRPPVILGHEFTGTIDEVGSAVTVFKPGDRVVAETTVESCGACYYCVTGNHNICANRLGLGRTGNGAFADYLMLRQQLIHRLPSNIDMVDGALMEPLACCTHAVCETANIHAGDQVLVIGPGAIGLCAMQVARAEGARVMIGGVSRDRDRLALASRLGAEQAIDAEKQNLQEVINDWTNGNGVDVLIECSGSAGGIRAALKLVRRQGQHVQMGLSGKETSIDLDLVTNRELRLLGSVNSKWTSWERALQLLSTCRVTTQPLVTSVLSLTDWEKGFRQQETGVGIKTVLVPDSNLANVQGLIEKRENREEAAKFIDFR